MKFSLFLLIFVLLQSCLSAELKIVKDVPYKTTTSDDYEKERCKLDIYLTDSKEKTPVFVWFHGGGMTANSKEVEKEVGAIARKFAANGVTFVAINYRLNPKVKYPAYIDDAAASVKWTIDNADKYGFDKKKIFIGGHSAGGYLTMMISYKNSSTEKCGLVLKDIAGTIPVSGQTITHTTVRKEMGISKSILIADERSPLYHSKDMKLPTFLLAGDKDLKMRAEESLLFYSAIKDNAVHNRYEVFKDRNHVSIVTRMIEKDDPAFKAILKFISEVEKK